MEEPEDALRESEAHYRRLVEASPYGIYATDAEGRITEANPALAEIVRRPVADLMGRRFFDLIDERDLAAVIEGFRQRILGDRQTRDLEFRIVRPDGETRRVHVRAAAIARAEAVVGSHGVVRDVTDEHAREEQLRRTERLASVGTLLSGVAHELNNPLNAIINFAQLMLLDPRPPDDQEALEIMRREADRAAKIVSDLRFIARQTQDETARREDISLNDVVEHVLKLRRYTHETSNVRVEERLAGDLPLVRANRSEMEQVLLNLVLNAEQAMESQDGDRRLEVRTTSGGGRVSLRVADTGPGIPQGQLDRIFDPFFTTKAPGEGTGLGLSLVHSIVGEHGGTVRVTSAPGEGAAFLVDLPRAPDAEAAVVEPAPLGEPPRPLRILVVDDEASIRDSLARFLRRRGHRVDEAGDGREALSLLAARGGAPYDVIVSDLRMPGLDGEQLLARLRGRGDRLDRRVVFMTGDAVSPRAARVLEAGSAPVLLKPVAPGEVARVVERHAEEVSSSPGEE